MILEKKGLSWDLMNGVRLTKQRREGKDQADRGIRMWKASGFRGSRATSLGMRLWSQTVGIYILASELLRQVHAFLRASVSSYHGNGNLDLIRQCRGWNRPQYWRLQYDARNPVRKPSVRVSSEVYLCNTKLFTETHQSWWKHTRVDEGAIMKRSDSVDGCYLRVRKSFGQ